MSEFNAGKFLTAVNSKPGEWHKGEYDVIHKEKYIGIGNPIYRSSYEKRVFTFMDLSDNVLKWGSEKLVIPYQFSLDEDNRSHKYYVDIFCVVKEKDGSVKKYAIEIKPKTQLSPPKKPSNPTKKAMKNYLYSASMYIKNRNKWKAADAWCRNNNIKFMLLTEDQIF